MSNIAMVKVIGTQHISLYWERRGYWEFAVVRLLVCSSGRQLNNSKKKKKKLKPAW
jgi:hypothetical protein